MSIAVPLTTVYANTRNGTATYVQSDGTVATQSALLARTDHWISGQRGRLFEPSRTNLALYSEDFSDGTWVKTRATVTANAVAAPDGNTTADYIVEDSSTNTHEVRQSVTIAANTVHTVTLFVAAGVGSTRALRIQFTEGTSTDGVRLLFNPHTGAITASEVFGAGSNLATSVEAFGSFYRVRLTGKINASATSARVVLFLQSNTSAFSASYAGDGVSGVYVWGAQIEAGEFATTFIPTSTVAVTRLADRASCSLSDIGFDAAGGSIFIEGRAYYNAAGSGGPRIFQIGDGTDNNRIILSVSEASSLLALNVIAGGVAQAFETIAYTSGAYFKAGIRIEGDNMVLSLGGSDTGADTSCTIPSGLSSIYWASDQTGANNGAAVFITKFATYAKEFADATMNAETA